MKRKGYFRTAVYVSLISVLGFGTYYTVELALDVREAFSEENIGNKVEEYSMSALEKGGDITVEAGTETAGKMARDSLKPAIISFLDWYEEFDRELREERKERELREFDEMMEGRYLAQA
ncbi:hypothetical protein CMI45_01380 [Candidatus Pacearchaeota archaeon]|nr:hypothetical protein [Candidatus Pacearchaeota archaeon]|tara:strand:+ start:463 stop:822 length:360 start_codon:yes stop_codon:yes gene_type:complete